MRAALTALALVALSGPALLPLPAAASMAQRGTPNGFADLVDNVMPAVVNISTASGQAANGEMNPAMRGGRSLGSGFIVDADGFVVTNYHVIEGAQTITVLLEDGTEHEATLRGVDRETDLAVLKIESDERLPFVRFGDSDAARVGEWVVAIGQPFGLGGSVSAGIISARNRDIQSGLYDDYIQTDAAINRGNSGGPLFDMRGRVIGVNTVIFSQTGGSVGVGFAVPSTLAERIVEQLIEFGETQRGYLGVFLEDVTPETQARLGLRSAEGAVVVGLPQSGSPAALSGIQQGDVIIRFDGKPVEERRDLTRAVADTTVGETVPVILIRSGREMRLTVTIARRETMTAAVNTGTVETAGLTLQAADSDMRDLLGLPADTDGPIVTHVDSLSPLSEVLRPGDVILEVGWERIRTPEAFESHLETLRHARSGPVQVLVRRDDELFYARVRP